MSDQRDAGWMKSASAEQIVAAQAAGELTRYLGGRTADEQSQDRVVESSRDRVLAAAYGLVSLLGRGDLDSTWFAAERARMDAAQLEKLAWVEEAPAAEVYAAEQSGDLDHLLGREPTEVDRIAGLLPNVDRTIIERSVAGAAS